MKKLSIAVITLVTIHSSQVFVSEMKGDEKIEKPQEQRPREYHIENKMA